MGAVVDQRKQSDAGSALGTAIAIDGVAMTYMTKKRGSAEALKPLSLDIRTGEFVSVVGTSGCGKSTLLKIVGGLLKATAGRVTVNGEVVSKPREDMGIVFQNPVLLPWKSVLENVLLVPKIQRLDKRMFRERASDLLRMVGLEGVESKYPFELSGGMQQRTSVVRALVPDPPILLMDEPFGALDAMTREQLNVDLQRIWLENRKTVLFITHSVPEAVFLSDRVVVMGSSPGRVLDVLDIELPRPRSLEVLATPAFGSYTGRVRGLLGVSNTSVD